MIAYVNSDTSGKSLENFAENAVIRLQVGPGTYLVFGRVVVRNDDGDSQNAGARITAKDGSDLSDRVDVRIPSGTAQTLGLQGTLRVLPGQTEMIDIRASTFRGSAGQSSLFTIEVTELKFHA